MRRFEEHFAALPVDMQVTCPKCNQVVDGQLQKSGEQVVLETRCPTCGTLREVHHDAIYTPLVSDHPNSPSETYGGSRIRPVIRRLPRTVETLCPECAAPSGRHQVVQGRQIYGRSTFQTAPVTFSIMAVTVAIYILGMLSSSLDDLLFQNLAQANWLVAARWDST